MIAEATLTLTLPKLHEAQSRIKRDALRINILACGRRFGKTRLGIDLEIGPSLGGFPVGWFAPTYKYLLEPWRDLKRVLAPVVKRISETEKRIELITGGSIDLWSLDDPNAGRGYRYARVVIDEAAMVRHLEESWTQAIRPTLTDFIGDAYFLSTPKGRDFFWRLWTLGQNASDGQYRSWRFPTLSNPYIAPGEIEDARKQLPDRVFRQEYLAEFIEDSGGVFRGVLEAIDTGECGPSRDGAGPFTVGIDLARTQDFTVICVVDGAGRQVSFERFNLISWERQIDAVRRTIERYPSAKVRVDATGVGDPIYERIRALGVRVEPFRFTAQSKESLIDNLAMQIEQGALRLMDIPEQTAELLAYEYELTPSRNVRMNAPSGMHDDCVIALALAAPQIRVLPSWSDALQMMD